MTTNDPITPRLEGESSKAYAAFLAYRDLGSRRSLDQARGNSGDGSVRCQRVLEEWSARWSWTDRSRDWDNHLQAVRDREWARVAARGSAKEAAKWERRREQAHEEAWDLALKIRRVAIAMLETPTHQVSISVDEESGKAVHTHIPGRWSFRDIPALARTVIDIQSVMLAAASRSLEGMTSEELDAIAARPDTAEVVGPTPAVAGDPPPPHPGVGAGANPPGTGD